MKALSASASVAPLATVFEISAADLGNDAVALALCLLGGLAQIVLAWLLCLDLRRLGQEEQSAQSLKGDPLRQLVGEIPFVGERRRHGHNLGARH